MIQIESEVMVLLAAVAVVAGAVVNLLIAYRNRRNASEIVAASFRLSAAAQTWRGAAEGELALTTKMLEFEHRLKALEMEKINGGK